MTTYQPKNPLEGEGRKDSIERMYRMFVEEELPKLEEDVLRVQAELRSFRSLADGMEPKERLEERVIEPLYRRRQRHPTLQMVSGTYRERALYRTVECAVV